MPFNFEDTCIFSNTLCNIYIYNSTNVMASNTKLLILSVICKSCTVIEQVMQNDSTEHCEPWQTDLYSSPKGVSSSEM